MNCYTFEFVMASADGAWVAAENHHDCLFVWPPERAELLVLANA